MRWLFSITFLSLAILGVTRVVEFASKPGEHVEKARVALLERRVKQIKAEIAAEDADLKSQTDKARTLLASLEARGESSVAGRWRKEIESLAERRRGLPKKLLVKLEALQAELTDARESDFIRLQAEHAKAEMEASIAMMEGETDQAATRRSIDERDLAALVNGFLNGVESLDLDAVGKLVHKSAKQQTCRSIEKLAQTRPEGDFRFSLRTDGDVEVLFGNRAAMTLTHVDGSWKITPRW